MIAEDMQTYSIVENHSFQKLLKLFDTLPIRRTIASTPNLYKSTKLKIVKLILNTKYVAITSDMWTSMNTKSYSTIAIHFFDAYGELKNFILSTQKLTDSMNRR